MLENLENAAGLIRQRIRTATTGLIGREQVAELMILAAVAQEHLLIIGPPGTAKSAVIRRVAAAFGGRYFEYMLGRFTEPNEIFGPIDLRKLKEGTVEIDTTGMLPEAEIAFLDEVFLGSTAILNTLLGVLNERVFRKGHTVKQCPLRICVAAANSLPEDEALAAFADRFLLHTFVQATPDHLLQDLLEGGWSSELHAIAQGDGMGSIALLAEAVKQVDMAAVRPQLVDAIRLLRQHGLSLSDRRLVKSQKLIAAATVLSGRNIATEADLWPLLYVLPTQAMQVAARDVLQGLLASACSLHLHAAVEQSVQQPKSRESRLLERAAELLAAEDAEPVQVEAVLKEIDANFDADSLAPALAQVRQQLVSTLEHAHTND